MAFFSGGCSVQALTFQADDGETLHLWRHGASGPKLVFLHGWTASHLEWSPFIHDLAKHYQVYRWDARGHGGHPATVATEPGVARMAADLAQMTDAFDLGGACFIGHSMGALTLWQYLRDFGSARIGSLCFIDQSPRLMTDADWQLGIYGDFDAARSEAFIAELRQDMAEAVLRLTALGLNDQARQGYLANRKGWQRARAALQAQAPEPLIACWQTLVTADYREVIAGIDRPSLLIYGGLSNFYRPEIAQWLLQRLPQGELRLYAEANHSPHLCEPPRFLADLTAFVPA